MSKPDNVINAFAGANFLFNFKTGPSFLVQWIPYDSNQFGTNQYSVAVMICETDRPDKTLSKWYSLETPNLNTSMIYLTKAINSVQ